MLIPFDRATILPLEVFRQWNFVADFECFFVEIYAKNVKSGYLNLILGTLGRGDAWPLLVARWKAHGRLSIRIIELSLLSITVLELWSEMCIDGLFSQAVDLFALKFYLDRVVPINHSPKN